MYNYEIYLNDNLVMTINDETLVKDTVASLVDLKDCRTIEIKKVKKPT